MVHGFNTLDAARNEAGASNLATRSIAAALIAPAILRMTTIFHQDDSIFHCDFLPSLLIHRNAVGVVRLCQPFADVERRSTWVSLDIGRQFGILGHNLL